MPDRPPIPSEVKDKLLVDAHFRCAICPQHVDIRNIHHIEEFHKGGPNTEENLIIVCPNCHVSIHQNPRVYTKKRLKMAKNKWIEQCGKPYPSMEERIKESPGLPLIFIPRTLLATLDQLQSNCSVPTTCMQVARKSSTEKRAVNGPCSLRSPFNLGCSTPLGYPEPPNFTGRTQERQMLTQWLREDREHPLL